MAMQLPLFYKSREVMFVNSCEPTKRVKLVKPDKMLQQLDPESIEIFFPTQVEKYGERPERLKDMCMADYYATINTQQVKGRRVIDHFQDNHDDETVANADDSSDDESADEDSGDNDRIDFIENGVRYTSRKKARVIRYVRYNKNTDPENFYRENILLFYPWRGDENLLFASCENYATLFNELKGIIDENAKKYEKQDVEDPSSTDHDRMNDMMDELASSLSQQNANDASEGQVDSYEHSFFNPPRPTYQRNINIGSDLGIASTKTDHLAPDYMSSENYFQLTRSLNLRQREFILDMMKRIKDWDPTQPPFIAFLSGG